jgi:predicted alpha/beta-fold hydrolase
MGWRVAVLRHRGWGHPITTPRVFDGCSFEDLSVLLGVITERYPGARIAAVGMSAGANVLVRYLGCAGDASPILAGLSVCNGFQSRHACELEHRGLTGKFYSWGLTKVMQETVSRNREKLEGLPGLDVAKALRCHRFSDFAAATAVPLYRFPSVDAYLAANQCITALPHIRRPVFFLQPADDPLFMPSVQDVIPYKELGQSERFLYMEVPYGAHLGWAEGHWRRNKVTFLTRVVEAWLTFLTNEWESSSTGAPTPVPQSPPTTNGAPPPSAVAPPSPTRYPAA